MTRLHWDDAWMEVAQIMARRSLCSRAQVGAVIVNCDYRIVATGYNGPPRNFDHRDEPCDAWCERRASDDHGASYANCPSLHAEANALLSADKSAWQGGTVYITGDVCADCAKLVANSGLARVVVLHEDGREYRNSDDAYRYLRALGIGVEVVPVPVPPDPDTIPTISMGHARTIQVRTIGGQWMNVTRE